MLKSMTAYKIGYKKFQNICYKFVFKSLNHKFISIDIKLPENLISLESVIRQKIQDKIRRGSIQFYITTFHNAENIHNTFNIDKVKRILCHLQRKGITIKEVSISDISFLSRSNNAQETEPKKKLKDFILKIVDNILEESIKLKEKEGNKICKIIDNLVNNIRINAAKIEDMLPRIHKEKERTLIEKLRELNNIISKESINNTELQKFVITFFLQKSIYEEIERLKIHIKHFKEEVQKGTTAKELDFLCQEMHREISTLLVKTENAKVSHIGVKIKKYIEDIREMLNNIE